MAALSRQIPWSSQPQVAAGINWANPLTRGLLSADTPFTVPAGRAVASRIGIAANGGSNNPTRFGGNFQLGNTSIAELTLFALSVRTGTANSVNYQRPIAIRYGVNSNGTGIYSEPYTGNTQISANVLYNDYTGSNITTGSGYLPSPANDILTTAMTFLVNDAAGLKLYINGVSAASPVATSNKTLSPDFYAVPYMADSSGGSACDDFPTALAAIWNRVLTAAEIARLHSNPWQIFQPQRRIIVTAAAAPGTLTGDVTTTGWTATPTGDFFATLDEVVASDTDYITSPTLGTGGPITMSIEPVTAGTYDVQIRAAYSGSAGQVRANLLDSSNVSQGVSSWQTLTSSPTTYTLSVTTTGTATRLRIEVQ